MNKRTEVCLAMILMSIAVTATDYVWTGNANDGDWRNKENFTVGGTIPDTTPGSSDSVTIPSKTTVTLEYDVTDADKKGSCEAFAGVGRIIPDDTSSIIDITVPPNTTLVLNGAIVTTRSATPANLKGKVFKRGEGTLTCVSETKLTNSTTSFDYATTFNVIEGVLRLPAGTSGLNCAVRTISVKTGATLFTPQMAGLSILGGMDSDVQSCVTNDGATVCNLLVQDGALAVLGGMIGGPISFTLDGGRLELANGANTTADVDVKVQKNRSSLAADAPGVLSLAKFGMKAANGNPSASSIGYAEKILLHLQGGGLRYLGSGETTDKTIVFQGNDDNFGFVDAGTNGGIEFAGTFTMARESTKDFRMKRLVLTGSNTVPATISGVIESPSTSRFGSSNYTFRVTKRGTGTWIMRHNDESDMRGVFAVQEGTLAFDTLAEQGVNSALGKSTILQKDVANVIVDPDTYGEDYAFLLGGGDTRGTLRYIGATNCVSSTRRFAVKGEGAVLNDGEGFLRLAGIKALDGTDKATLVLGGSNASDNVADDVGDGVDGVLSVVKEGEGTWQLGTNLTFTGGLTVKAGRLLVGPPPYTWYRWTLKGNFYTPEGSANGKKGNSTERLVGAAALGLFDSTGMNQATNLDDSAYFSWNGVNYVNGALTYMTLPAVFAVAPDVSQFVALNPGECRLAENNGHTYVASSMDVASLFDGAGETYFRMSDSVTARQLIPVPTNSASWRVIELRLPSAARPVVSYDFASITGADLRQNIQYATLEGSVNGKDWDVLDDYGTNTCPVAGLVWRKTGTAFPETPGTAHEGFPIASGPGGQTAFAATSVRVDRGATLAASTTNALTVAGIQIDADGMGELSGFALAEGGTISIVNPKPEREYAVPADLTGVALPSSFSLVVDPECGRRTAVMAPDRKSIRIMARGLAISIH